MPQRQSSTLETYGWSKLPPIPDDYLANDGSFPRNRGPWWWLWFRTPVIVVILIVLGFLAGRFTAPLPLSHAPTPPHVVVRTLTTVQTFTGSNSQPTNSFEVSANWRLSWLCAPNASKTGQYQLKIDLNSAETGSNSAGTGSFISTPVDQPCQLNAASGSMQESQGGTFYLYVTSKGPWTIEIQMLK